MLNDMPQEYKYLFGPVPSRRLGASLGVDLMPHKTCSLDCIYCECGKTTHLTVRRKEYTPVDKVQKELASFLSQKPALDYITFSGSGEPSLHSRINEIVFFLKKEFPQYKLALLSNGTLLHNPEVREDILDIDVVKISIDTVSEDTFVRLNRPHSDLSLENILNGIISFKKIFKKQLWVEVFLVPGINDDNAEIESIKNFIENTHPDRIHVNTLDRPGAEKWVRAADHEKLKRVSDVLGDVTSIKLKEIYPTKEKDIVDFRHHLLSTIKRRPCTADDVSKILGTQLSETKKHLEALSQKGEIEKQKMSRGVFYMLKS